MTDATDLWAACEASYEAKGLTLLTNVRDRSAVAADDTVGADAAQSIIDMFALYAQVDYVSTNAIHVEVGMQGVIALLWRRGGTSTNIAKVKWEDWVELATKLRQTDPRGHEGPESNSGVSQPSELSNGRTTVPWSHPSALPGGRGYMPRRILSDDF